MRIQQLLESPKDELSIQRVAQAVLDFIKKSVQDGNIETSPNGTRFIAPVKLKSFIPKGSWGHLYTVFAHTDVFVHFINNQYSASQTGRNGVHGRYFGGLNGLNLYVDIRDNTLVDEKDVLSTIVHELRHRVDDARSKGKAFSNKREREKPYLEQPSEINARFSEAVAATVRRMREAWDAGAPMTVQQFIGAFEEVAEKHNLMSVFKRGGENDKTNEFIHFFTNGIFGRQTPPDTIRNMVQSMHNMSSDQPVGPTGDKQYRRLLSRLSLIYQATIDQWNKQK